VKIQVIGGGPAGLFLAYLMARADAGHEIHVYERDPEGASYGWGLVFSDVALSFVREVAPEVYDAITRGRIRRPGSDSLQQAAIKSTQWYEHLGSKLDLDPISFAYDYLRRSGRVSHAEIQKRDPALAAAYEKLHPANPLET
jgi:2-polyprenyl-6-methoxyphenol hydroxylase-like FAD-dependent oxidoreductase